MSLIPCTQSCLYQRDGLCTLEQASSAASLASPNDLCLNFTPRSNQHSDGLSDIRNPDQGESFRSR